jgi:GNAT superfamily N-acetyltransferase
MPRQSSKTSNRQLEQKKEGDAQGDERKKSIKSSCMNKRLHIRAVDHGDTIAVQALLQQLGYAITSEQIAEKIDLFAHKTGHYAFVAEIDSRIAGFMSLHVLEWFHRLDCLGRLSAIVIDKEARGAGIGRAMVQFAEQKAIQAGCSIMEVSSSLHRKAEGTYDFYAALDYLEANTHASYFRKNLI